VRGLALLSNSSEESDRWSPIIAFDKCGAALSKLFTIVLPDAAALLGDDIALDALGLVDGGDFMTGGSPRTVVAFVPASVTKR
jgi:hypothetical protein